MSRKDDIMHIAELYVDDYLDHGWRFKSVARNGDGEITIKFEKKEIVKCVPTRYGYKWF